MTWLEKYQQEYYHWLMPKDRGSKFGLADGHCHRGDGFMLMFELLLTQKHCDFEIIETGTLRNPGRWKDGQSSKLFSEFVDFYGGRVRSVDIDSKAVETANNFIDNECFLATCRDSVEFLQQQSDLDRVDLYYLDSWDVTWENDTASAEHHLQEFLCIEPYLKSKAVVAIDDNSRLRSTGVRTGKGRRIVEYLSNKGMTPIYDAYQIIYQF